VPHCLKASASAAGPRLQVIELSSYGVFSDQWSGHCGLLGRPWGSLEAVWGHLGASWGLLGGCFLVSTITTVGLLFIRVHPDSKLRFPKYELRRGIFVCFC
jgi:hypothetical protein